MSNGSGSDVEADVVDIKIRSTPQSDHKRIGLPAYAGTFGTSMLVQGFTVLQGILTARLLGPVGRGEYAAVILWPSVFAAIGIFGTNIALARAAAKMEQYDRVVRTAVLLALMTSSLASILCYLGIPYLLPAANMRLLDMCRTYVVFIVLNHLALDLIAVDQGVGNFRRFNFTRAILHPVYLCFLIVMWVNNVRSVAWAAIGLLAANLVVVVMRFVLVLRQVRPWGPLYHPVRAIRESVRFGLAGAATPLYSQADKAILLWLLGTEDLGLYVVAISASMVVGSITQSAGIVSFTVAAQAQQGQGFETLAKTVRVSALLSLIFGGLLAVMMPWLLPLVYGVEFAPAVNPARLLILGSALAGLANVLDQAMRGQGRAFVGLEGRFAGLAVMAALGYVLSRQWGLMGMCLAFFFGQVTCFSVFMSCVTDHYGQGIHAIRAFAVKRSDVAELCARLRRAAAAASSS